jgi:hypothetical protein
MSNTGQPDSRLGLDDVSGEISRIFFNKGMQSGGPSYSDGYRPPSSGYGVPQGPMLDDNGFSTSRSLYSLYRGNQYCIIPISCKTIIIKTYPELLLLIFVLL